LVFAAGELRDQARDTSSEKRRRHDGGIQPVLLDHYSPKALKKKQKKQAWPTCVSEKKTCLSDMWFHVLS